MSDYIQSQQFIFINKSKLAVTWSESWFNQLFQVRKFNYFDYNINILFSHPILAHKNDFNIQVQALI